MLQFWFSCMNLLHNQKHHIKWGKKLPRFANRKIAKMAFT